MCVCGFIIVICFILICTWSLIRLVSLKGSASWLWYFLGTFTYIAFLILYFQKITRCRYMTNIFNNTSHLILNFASFISVTNNSLFPILFYFVAVVKYHVNTVKLIKQWWGLLQTMWKPQQTNNKTTVGLTTDIRISLGRDRLERSRIDEPSFPHWYFGSTHSCNWRQQHSTTSKSVIAFAIKLSWNCTIRYW